MNWEYGNWVHEPWGWGGGGAGVLIQNLNPRMQKITAPKIPWASRGLAGLAQAEV